MNEKISSSNINKKEENHSFMNSQNNINFNSKGQILNMINPDNTLKKEKYIKIENNKNLFENDNNILSIENKSNLFSNIKN